MVLHEKPPNAGKVLGPAPLARGATPNCITIAPSVAEPPPRTAPPSPSSLVALLLRPRELPLRPRVRRRRRFQFRPRENAGCRRHPTPARTRGTRRAAPPAGGAGPGGSGRPDRSPQWPDPAHPAKRRTAALQVNDRPGLSVRSDHSTWSDTLEVGGRSSRCGRRPRFAGLGHAGLYQTKRRFGRPGLTAPAAARPRQAHQP